VPLVEMTFPLGALLVVIDEIVNRRAAGARHLAYSVLL